MGLADELQRLTELHQSGALSEAEFAQAKGRLLDGSGTPEIVPPPATQPRKSRPSKFEADGQLAPVAVRYSLWTSLFWLGLSLAILGFGLFISISESLHTARSGSNPSPVLSLMMPAVCLPFLIPGLIGLSRKPRMILSKDGIEGPITGGRRVEWSEVTDYAYKSHYAAKLTLRLRDGSTLELKTFNQNFIDFSPDLLRVYSLVANRMQTGRFAYPDAEKIQWKEVAIIAGVMIVILVGIVLLALSTR